MSEEKCPHYTELINSNWSNSNNTWLFSTHLIAGHQARKYHSCRVNVYKCFVLFFYQKNAFFISIFLIFQTLNIQCENNHNSKHLNLKNESAAHRIIADFVFRFTYF